MESHQTAFTKVLGWNPASNKVEKLRVDSATYPLGTIYSNAEVTIYSSFILDFSYSAQCNTFVLVRVSL